jgi:hypothetical protein
MKAAKPGHHYDEASHQWLPDVPAENAAPAAPAAPAEPNTKE